MNGWVRRAGGGGLGGEYDRSLGACKRREDKGGEKRTEILLINDSSMQGHLKTKPESTYNGASLLSVSPDFNGRTVPVRRHILGQKCCSAAPAAAPPRLRA